MGRFDGNPKPMCPGCLRRVYGIEKDGGWWCTNCDHWVVRPPRQVNKHQRDIQRLFEIAEETVSGFGYFGDRERRRKELGRLRKTLDKPART